MKLSESIRREAAEVERPDSSEVGESMTMISDGIVAKELSMAINLKR